MAEDDTLTKALADVRRRREELQAEHDRLSLELSKLRLAEKSLAALVEGSPFGGEDSSSLDRGDDGEPSRGRTGRRGSRGPRANSAKGRLRALLSGLGPQGLAQAEILRRLPDVAPATLNAYLSTMTSSGEIIRNGDFYRIEVGEAEESLEGDGEEPSGDEEE